MGAPTTADTQPDWQARADELHERGGIPERRAEIVALTEAGRTHQQIADVIDWNRSGIWKEIDAYRDQRDEADWLLENAPDL